MVIKKRMKRKPYTADQVLMILSTGLQQARDIALNNEDPGMKLRACQAMGQVANAWKGITESHALEQRIEALENQILRKVI